MRMMSAPSEARLDYHYKEQLLEYDELFTKLARKSDQTLIKCWLEILNVAPREQKLARNGLLLLIFSHLNEYGTLKYPFTDMRNYGLDLNDVLNHYEETFLFKRKQKFGRPIENEETTASLPESLDDSPPPLPPKDYPMIEDVSASTFDLISTTKRKSLPKIPERDNPGCHNTATVIQKDSFDSHECYRNQAASFKDEIKFKEKDKKIVNELNELFDSVIGENVNNESSISPTDVSEIENNRVPTEEPSPELSISQEFFEMIKLERKVLFNKLEDTPEWEYMQDQSKLSYDELIAKLTKQIPLLEAELNHYEDSPEPRRSPIKSNLPRRPLKRNPIKSEINKIPDFCKRSGKCSSDASTEDNSNISSIQERRPQGHNKTIISPQLQAEISELSKRNAELRSEVLRYYNKNGTLKSFLRMPKMSEGKDYLSGFNFGAYHALRHFQSWRGLPQGKCFNWQHYRRALRKRCLRGSRHQLQQRVLDGRRQLLLVRMMYILGLKQLFTHVSVYKLVRQDLQFLLQELERKYLQLVSELQSKFYKISK